MTKPRKRDEGFQALKLWLLERILLRDWVFELPVVQATDVAQIAALCQQLGLLDPRARVGVTAIGMALGELGCPVWRTNRLRVRVIDEEEARQRELWQWEALLRRRRAG